MSSSNQNITNSTSETISGQETVTPPPVVCQSSYKAPASVLLEQQRHESAAVMSQQYGVYLESCSRTSACADDETYVDVVDDDYGYVDCAADELHSADDSFSLQIINDQNAARENYVSNPYYVKVLSE